ncbi:MAG: LysR family transcriptional regulator [Deltaproteobacteria bacterium]|jgi:molybdate transport system regulatory protein|nr:MAG: LysR family transcriptional regulator [Deltaproteobacteria bacterium]
MAKLQLRSNQWIVDNQNNIIIGKGRMEILENIEKTGSINQAAKMMKMSYKAAWSKIKATEKHLNTSIVHADRKEGTRLSREGKELLEKYRLLKRKCMSADDKIFSRIFDKSEISGF